AELTSSSPRPTPKAAGGVLRLPLAAALLLAWIGCAATVAAALPSAPLPTVKSSVATTNPLDPTSPPTGTSPGQTILTAQIALSRRGLSPGSIDGLMGPQTHAALRAFQQKENLPLTCELDEATLARLTLDVSPTTNYVVTSNDLARLRPLSPTWLGKSQQ